MRQIYLLAGILIVFVGMTAPVHADLDDLEDLESQQAPEKKVAPTPKPAHSPKRQVPTRSPASTPTETPFTRPDLNPELKDNTEKSKSQALETEISAPPQSKKPDKRIKTKPEDQDTGEKHPVRLKSKGLRAQKDGGVVELQDDVNITQGPLSLTADYSKVFLDSESNEVIRANAEGNVRMNKDSDDPKEVIKARAKTAVFLNKERKVILKGDAQLWRGSSLLKGKQIVYDLASGWITFDSAEGVMQPEN